jgi:hypothetical protein
MVIVLNNYQKHRISALLLFADTMPKNIPCEAVKRKEINVQGKEILEKISSYCYPGHPDAGSENGNIL